MLHAFFITIKVATVVSVTLHYANIFVATLTGVLALAIDILHFFHSRGLPLMFARKMFDKKYRRVQSQLSLAYRRIQFLESENTHLLMMGTKDKNPIMSASIHVLRHTLKHSNDLSDADRTILEASVKQLILLENSSATMYPKQMRRGSNATTLER